MNLHGHDIAVCSWSLQPEGMEELVDSVRRLGLSHVQLATAPLLFLDDKQTHRELGFLRSANLKVTAGMIAFPGEDYSTIASTRLTCGYVPDNDWPLRLQMTLTVGKLLASIGVDKLTAHVGFVPSSSDSRYEVVLARVAEIAQGLAEHGVSLGMETGQESAPELLQFMNDLNARNVWVNFDPANMILYGGGDPVEAIRILGRHIEHVHVKDAVMSAQPGTIWGEEVPFGTGEVDPEEFLLALREIEYAGPLAIEREAGSQRFEDVQIAIETLGDAVAVEE